MGPALISRPVLGALPTLRRLPGPSFTPLQPRLRAGRSPPSCSCGGRGGGRYRGWVSAQNVLPPRVEARASLLTGPGSCVNDSPPEGSCCPVCTHDSLSTHSCLPTVGTWSPDRGVGDREGREAWVAVTHGLSPLSFTKGGSPWSPANPI